MIKGAERIQGVETYYFATKLAEIRTLISAGKDIVNLGIGSPDMQPPEEVRTKLSEVALEKNIHAYQPYTGIPSLKIAFANWYNKFFNVDLDPSSEILPLIGSKEGIMHISMAFLNPDDHVLVPNPGYPAYKAVSKICGAKVINYNLCSENNYLPDIKELSELDLDRVKIMWINYPHMPTGANATMTYFKSLLALAKKHQFLICHDNPYAFILSEAPLSIFQLKDAKSHCLELTSLSKHYNMPGWRVGAVIANSEYIKNILKFKSNMDSGMFKGIQLASISALEQSEQWFEELNKVYKERKKLVLELLDLLDCQYDESNSGLFVWAKISDKWQNGSELSEYLLHEKNVFITPGFIFGTQGENYVRVSLCQPSSLIQKAIDRCK